MVMGIDDIIGGVLNGVVAPIVNRFFPDPQKAAEFQLELTKALQESDLAQLKVDEAEANSGKWFEADWRPMIGWTGALGLFWNYITLPMIKMICGMVHYVPEPGTLTTLDLAPLLPLIIAMLGIGASVYHFPDKK